MRDIRDSGMVVEDPLINEYINEVGNRIAAQTNDGDHDFTFFVVDDPRINAFALPGGYIGVHTGLLEATRSEDELAGVLAHEVAHVTQRHIARAIHASSRQSMLSTAIMLGAIIAGAAGGGADVVQAGMAVAQGTAAQRKSISRAPTSTRPTASALPRLLMQVSIPTAWPHSSMSCRARTTGHRMNGRRIS